MSYVQVRNFNAVRRPFLKVFVGAIFTYQLLYWSWEKMRTDEIMEERTTEIKELEDEIESYKSRKVGSGV